tara:strand:- start:62 stop:508 length:447 start_codon:yes stop_codon:yes gene_type:complete
MIKKIINLFKSKKKQKIKKETLINKKNSAEVINFVNTAKKKKKIQTEKMEINKMDELAIELVENYRVASNKSFLSIGYCFYFLLFRVMQMMIFQISFPIYRYYHRTASKQIIRNHKAWLHEFKEWNEAPTEKKLIGEKRKDDENETLH